MGKEGADEKLCAVCCEISCRKRERCSVALTQDFTTRLKMVGVSQIPVAKSRSVASPLDLSF